MKNGKCIKCDSDEVYINEMSWGQYGSFMSNTIPIALFTHAVLEIVACAECGYIERYIKNESKLEKIKKDWRKVNSPSFQQ